MEQEITHKTKRFDELSVKEKRNFLKAVSELCNKSVTVYNFLINQIHLYQTPLDPVGDIHSTITEDGEKIIHKEDIS